MQDSVIGRELKFLRKLEYIKKEKREYSINPKKSKEIKSFLEYHQKEDDKLYSFIPKLFIYLISISGILLIMFLSIFNKVDLSMLPNQTSIFPNQTFTFRTSGFPHFIVRMSQAIINWILIILIGIWIWFNLKFKRKSAK